jgi:hypothetical protein
MYNNRQAKVTEQMFLKVQNKRAEDANKIGTELILIRGGEKKRQGKKIYSSFI